MTSSFLYVFTKPGYCSPYSIKKRVTADGTMVDEPVKVNHVRRMKVSIAITIEIADIA